MSSTGTAGRSASKAGFVLTAVPIVEADTLRDRVPDTRPLRDVRVPAGTSLRVYATSLRLLPRAALLGARTKVGGRRRDPDHRRGRDGVRRLRDRPARRVERGSRPGRGAGDAPPLPD